MGEGIEAKDRKREDIDKKVVHTQAAVEFNTVYAFALIAIVVIAALIYFFFAVPSSIVPDHCGFSAYVNCEQVAIGSNSASGGATAVLLLSNPQRYAVEDPAVSVNITGVGSYGGTCNPGFVLPDGIIECAVNFNSKIVKNQLLNGEMYLTVTVCTEATQAGCGALGSSPIQQTYSGTFVVHSTSSLVLPGCSVSLQMLNTTQILGGEDELIANVKILGTVVAGATVEFSSKDSGVSFLPEYSNTDSNGNAISYASSTTTQNAGVSATFGDCSASNTIDFSMPIYITFADNIPNTGYNVIAVGISSYSLLPFQIATSPSQGLAYAYNTLVPDPPTTQYVYNSISGCGTASQSGTVSSSSDCTVTANYLTQYYLSMSVNGLGSVSPANNFYNFNSLVAISETPYETYSFTGWDGIGAGSYTGTSASASVTMNSPVSETANFEITPAAVVNTIQVNGMPVDVAFSPDGSTAYVIGNGANGGVNEALNIINVASNTVTGAIFWGWGGGPIDLTGVAASPLGNIVYVVHNDKESLYVIDTATDSETNTVALAEEPYDVAFSPTGSFAYIVGAYSTTGAVNVIDTATNVIADTLTPGGVPIGVAFSPDGSRAYVTVADGNVVRVISTATNTIVNSIGWGNADTAPYNIAFSPDGSFAYVTDYGDQNAAGNTVAVIDVSSNAVVNTITVGKDPYDVAFNPSGTLAYVTNSGDNTVSVISTATNTVVGTVAVGNSPEGVAFNPSGTLAYVTNSGSYSVSVISQS